MIDKAVAVSREGLNSWSKKDVTERKAILFNVANVMHAQRARTIAVMSRDAGKTVSESDPEVSEAIDFARYYASTGVDDSDSKAVGVVLVVPPWNFPYAIPAGGLCAALAAGNSVVAKAAEQTPLIAFEAVRLFHRAGLPADALHLLPGRGETVGAALTADLRVAGVCFTGGTSTARLINRTLAGRDGPIIPLIAETGGLNGLFVDTTALREQVIDDMITSAFGSAGQRCSALRLAFLPNATADSLIEGLIGAMNELEIGDPALPATDTGPVIDADARGLLEKHLARMKGEAKLLHQIDPGALAEKGTGFGPALVELSSLDQITEETFGPVLHILRYDPDNIAATGAALHAKGYGLTLGIHSRLESFHAAVKAAMPAGNTYVNRSMIGAVVGVQPFGGEGLSGTGPKAGGPHYLHRFATERVVSVNITAQGGDAELLSL